MTVEKTYHDTTYYVPETKDKNWGPTGTALLSRFIDDLDTLVSLISTAPVFKFDVATSTLAASATLTQTKLCHLVSGDGGAVTLDTTTAIADGSTDMIWLVLVGNHSTNTVTIQHGANTNLNGDITLGNGEAIFLYWNDTNSEWRELFRSH